ncbi:ABC transporter ATP-binding protein [Limibacter armeniacum]|uniref:ABC transporter ATP-binding protein n=1 Tax=Limibacter armeniacum TaxID=466084 RepID=UPI002FE5D4CE
MMDNDTILNAYEEVVTGYVSGKKKKVVGRYEHLTMAKGEFICLIGPNGVGKSTLMRSLTGLQPLIGGRIWLDGYFLDEYGSKNLAKKIAIVLTDQLQTGNMTAREIVQMGRYPYTGMMGHLTKEDHDLVEEVMMLTGTLSLADNTFLKLSDGERQKVMLARALAQDTDIIVLDEPTAFLDMLNRIEMIRLLRTIARDKEKTILLSTHELELALQAADTIWLLKKEGGYFSGGADDLVLSGLLEKYFTSEGISFIPEMGVFQFSEPLGNSTFDIKLENSKMSLSQVQTAQMEVRKVWAQRILEREGYKQDSQSPDFVVTYFPLENNNAFRWVIDKGGKSYSCDTNLKDLLKVIRQLV